MNCKITELRRQLTDMQTLLDTYEHCHVDSVTPEEKIIERTKAKCIEAIRSNHSASSLLTETEQAIKAITDVE